MDVTLYNCICDIFCTLLGLHGMISPSSIRQRLPACTKLAQISVRTAKWNGVRTATYLPDLGSQYICKSIHIRPQMQFFPLDSRL